MLKIKWKVSAVPTGQYRCFEKRGWPYADYPEDKTCAAIYCDKEYDPAEIRAGKLFDLTLRVAVYTDGVRWDWSTIGKFHKITLQEAKLIVHNHIKARPEIQPQG